jgi:hypothetical protein
MRSTVRWVFRGAALFAALLATVQPVLGSFSFFRFSDSISYDTIHTVVGAGIYYLSMALAALAVFTRFQRRWVLLAVCLVQVVAVHAQLFLGVRSETNAILLAYHIPLGVLILVLTYLIAGPSFGVTRETRLA